MMLIWRPGALAGLLPLAVLAATLPAEAASRSAISRASAVGAPQALEDVVVYDMRRGESLFWLAQRYLNRRADYASVQKINRIANPHRIPVGTRLRIPLALLKSEPLNARIVAVRGTVHLNSNGRDIAPEIGADIPQGTALETGRDGFITLTLPNGSRTSLPTLTRIRIEKLRRIILTGSIDYDFVVDAGKLETQASPLGQDPNNRFRVRTPRAIAAVRGTQFRVGLENASSLAEVLEGTVAAGSDQGAPAKLAAGLGAVITSDGRVATETLLPPPELLRPGKVQVDPMVELALAPQDQARGYHLQIAEDAGFTKVLAEATGETTSVAFPDIPNGSLFVRVSAIAKSGLEGMAKTYAMRRVLAGLTASASADADTMRFAWGGQGEGRRIYHFQLGTVDESRPLLVDEGGLTQDGIALRDLPPGLYRWRVGVRQLTGEGIVENWLPFEKLTVAAQER